MRTQHDLVSALAQREDLAPDPDPVLAGARAAATSYRRRRAVTTGVIATIVIAATAAVPTLLSWSPFGSADPPVVVPDAGAPRPPFAFTIEPGTIAGFELHPFQVGPDYQIMRILPAGEDEPVAELVVYRPEPDFDIGDGAPALRWEYTPDGYAEILDYSDPPLDDATLQQLADGLRFTEPYSVRLPYRLDYMPAGMTPNTVAQNTARRGAFGSALLLEAPDADPSAPPTMDIMVGDEFAIDAPDWDPQPTTIAGRPAECGDIVDGRRCLIEFDEFTLDVGFSNVAEDELAQLVAGMHPATWDDPTTWYDIDDALPDQ